LNRDRDQIKTMEYIIQNDRSALRVISELCQKAQRTCLNKGWRVPREYGDIKEYADGAQYFQDKHHRQFLEKHPPDQNQSKIGWFL